MKRADHPFIFWISHYHGEAVAKELQSLPLIHLSQENLSHLFNDKKQDVPETCIFPEQWDSAEPIKRLPFDEFCFLMTIPFVNNTVFGRFSIINDTYESDGYADIDLHIAVQSEASMDSSFADVENSATNTLIGMRFRRMFDKGESIDLLKPTHLFATCVGDKKEEFEMYFGDIAADKKMQEWVMHSWGMLLRFFKYLETADLYPVKIQGTKKKKPAKGKQSSKNAKKMRLSAPYRDQSLATVRYLNVLPTKNIESKRGGGHSSPMPHRRRSTYRTLSHPRFKDHPKYGINKGVPVKGSFVGPKEAIISGNEYRVLEISEHGQVLDY